LERKSITQRVCDAIMPTAHLNPDADQRDDQSDVAEIEEVGRPIVA
jgi:hypothetical protein